MIIGDMTQNTHANERKEVKAPTTPRNQLQAGIENPNTVAAPKVVLGEMWWRGHG